MRRILAIAAIFIMITVLCSCNYQMVDLTYNFDYVYIKLPTGEIIEGEVQAWRDYECDIFDPCQQCLSNISLLL